MSEREDWVEEAVHSGKLEELDVSEACESDLLDYVAGLIDADELVERTQSRYRK